MGGKLKLASGDRWYEKESKLPAGDIEVEAIDFQGVTVTDRGLENLRRLPMRELDLSGSLITPAGFRTLAEFKTLRLLVIKDLPKLDLVSLRENAQKLQKSLPDCKIVTE